MKLTARFALVNGALVITLFALTFGYLMFRQSCAAHEALRLKTRNTSSLLAPISVPYYQNFEYGALDQFINEAKKDSEIQGAAFLDPKGAVLAGKTNEVAAPDALLLIETPIISASGENLGKLKVLANENALHAEMRHTGLAMVCLGAISCLIFAGSSVLALRQTVISPIRRSAESFFEVADQVASASGQISSSSQSLAEGASEQAASLEETSASLEEIASMTKRNAENALSAKDLSSDTRQAAEAGSANMQEMNHAMADIQSASSNIAKIIKTIDEIAFQTNILALNAAVEAARAGEAGAGFAVVADEVRNLAQRSAQAAKETAEKIEDSIAKSANGVAISGKVTESLTQIVTKARQVDELVAEIATASREQSQGIDQVNTAVTQMDKVTQTNAASAEESASASEELTAQADTLRELVADLQKLVTGAGKTSQPASREPPEDLHA